MPARFSRMLEVHVVLTLAFVEITVAFKIILSCGFTRSRASACEIIIGEGVASILITEKAEAD